MEVHIKDLKTSLGPVIFTMDMNNCIFSRIYDYAQNFIPWICSIRKISVYQLYIDV